MKKKLLFITSLIFCSFSFSQGVIGNPQVSNPILLKSTVTAVSASTSSAVFGQKNGVLQSIGQSGIVGTTGGNSMEIQQGFLSNFRTYSIKNSNQPELNHNIPVVISPNPFSEYINVVFAEKTKHPIHLKIYDTNGKVFTYQTYPAAKRFVVPMNNFSIGTYIVQLVSGEKKYVEKIFKNQ